MGTPQADNPEACRASGKDHTAGSALHATISAETALAIIHADILDKDGVFPTETPGILQPVPMLGMIAGAFVRITFNPYVFLYA